MSSSGKKVDSTDFARALLLSGLLGVLWFGLLATLIFVVPKHEKTFVENRMALPRVTEWIIEIARWCVKYWFVIVVMITVACLAIGALQVALRARRFANWGVGSIWLLLALIPVGGFIATWQFVTAFPVAFRFIPNGEKHFETRSMALSASPQVEKEWRDHLTEFGLKDERLDHYLIFLDALWDQEQRIRPEISKDCCVRLATLDVVIIADWQAEFRRVADFRPNAPGVASLLIQHDRLFVGTKLNTEEMRLIKGRLRTVPKSAVEKWDELSVLGVVRRLPAIDNEFQACAAMDLIRRDELFRNNQWEAAAFHSLCDELMTRNKVR